MSSHKLRVRYARQAQSDITDILLYSEQRWGKRQREVYRATLRKTISILASEPEIGRARDDQLPGMKSHPTGSHVIYYMPLDNELLVVRVLHNRRDPDREEW